MADDYNGIPIPENQDPEPGSGDQNDNIPDWMKDAGWETSSGTFDESKPIFDDLDDEEGIVPADIPAWLEDAAPEGFRSDPNAIPAFEGLDVDEPFITTGDLVPPPSMQMPSEEEQPEETREESFDIPTWLENLELDEDSQETAVAWLENMPESLRATEEELQAAKGFPVDEPEVIEEPVDELAWVDEIALEPEQPIVSDADGQAALSEDLVASDLIPETGDLGRIFKQDEIESLDRELPSWLKELGDDEPAAPADDDTQPTPPAEEISLPPEAQFDTMPEWLRAAERADIPVAPAEEAAEPVSEETSEFPTWLSEFEDSTPQIAAEDEKLEWLDSLFADELAAEPAEPFGQEDFEEAAAQDEPALPAMEFDETIPGEPAAIYEEHGQGRGVSPNDETLNAQVPDWLSRIDELGDSEEPESAFLDSFQPADAGEPSLSEEEFDLADSWLDQISEKPPAARDEIAPQESGVADWLGEMEDLEEVSPADGLLDTEEPFPGAAPEEEPPIGLETAKYLRREKPVSEDKPDDLPDWLAELREAGDQSLTLEEAIRQSDHDLNEAEVDFLKRVEEQHEEEADWLSKLDQYDVQPDLGEPPPAARPVEPTGTRRSQEEDQPQEPIVSGGILDRLRETGEFKAGEDVPQWLADIKKAEDPQETAVLWLQQFVNQGSDVDIKDEIKRYTDELDPGDSIPKWMEDLKNEEDPQTTAMLWLEKLSAARQAQAPPEPAPPAEEDSDWLADLEREAAQSAESQAPEELKDFDDPDAGWLADLEIDEKIKSAEGDLPDWSKLEGDAPQVEPPWMKATSPLEGEFYTDELAGGEEKEVEIPDWLAGYTEGEGPEKTQESPEDEEYTWLSATDAPAAPKTPLDLNKAAISQLEGILGISHEIARGIVSYREKHGPFRDFSDLKNIPEITDEQTIDILKPEVFLSEAPPEETPPATASKPKAEPAPPKQKPAAPPARTESFEELLVTARARISAREINEATQLYATLIKKKKFLDEVVEDLQKASLDHPLEISIQKTLGDAFMQKDMLEKALEAYSKAEDLLT